MWKVADRESHLSLGVHSFYWDQSCRHTAPAWLISAVQTPAPSHSPTPKQKQVFNINHVAGINFCGHTDRACPRPQAYIHQHSHQDSIPRAQSLSPSILGPAPILKTGLSLQCAAFGHHRPAELAPFLTLSTYSSLNGSCKLLLSQTYWNQVKWQVPHIDVFCPSAYWNRTVFGLGLKGQYSPVSFLSFYFI